MSTRLRRSATLAGRVLGADGAPVAGVTVWGVSGDGSYRGTLPTDNDGWFIWARSSPGPYRLFAHAPALGSVLSEEIPGERVLSGWVGDLVLIEGACVRGRVEFPDGSPVSAVTLSCEPLHGRHAMFPFDVPWGVAKMPVGITTDSDGRFVMAGLAPGTYVLRLGESGSYGRVIEVVRTGDGPLRVVAPYPRRVLRVVDVEGAPVVECTVLVRTRVNQYASLRKVERRRLDDTMELWSPPGARIEVAAFADATNYVEQTFQVGETLWDEEWTCRLNPCPNGTGGLYVGVDKGPFEIRLATPLLGLPLPGGEYEGTAPGVLVPAVPCGQWRLSAQSSPSLVPLDSAWASQEQVVDVLARCVSRVAAEGRPLGALEIVCEDPEGVGILDPPLVEVSEPSLPVEEEAGTAFRSSSCVSAYLNLAPGLRGVAVHVPGYATVRRVYRVASGEVTRVVLRLADAQAPVPARRPVDSAR